MSEDSGLGFRIRPLPSKANNPASPAAAPRVAEPAAGKAAAAPAPPPPAVTPPRPTAESARAAPFAARHTGGRFRRAQSALAFLGTVAAAGLASEARSRRGPNGFWWVEVPVAWDLAAALLSSAGGEPYAGSDALWVALLATGGSPATPAGRQAHDSGDLLLHAVDGSPGERLRAAEWPSATLADLLVATRLRRAPPVALDKAVVIAPGAIARFAVRRAVQLGLTVRIGAARRSPLSGGAASGAVWLDIAWRGQRTPEAFLHALRRFPHTSVARSLAPDGLAEAALLVDVDHAAPLSAALVAALIPAGEHWLLGAPESGHWRIERLGEAGDAAELIELPSPLPAPQVSPGGSAQQALAAARAPIPLRLTPRPSLAGVPDAVLLDDRELAWLRDALIGKPLADTAYLALGPARHLLLAPGGLLATVPFGLPLRRIGPGGLLLQEGQALHPPLPEAARASAFPCPEGQLLALTRAADGDAVEATRFAADSLTPVWALWIGEAPAVGEGIGGELAQRVRQLAKSLQPPSRLREKAAKWIPALRPAPVLERDRLLREALAHEHGGRYAEAAQCLEKAGELAAAGRLYERAAGEVR